MQPILGNLRAAASTGNLRRNPLYLIAFLIFFLYGANKLADYVIGNDMSGLAYVALSVIVGASTVAMFNMNTYQNFAMNCVLTYVRIRL